LTSNIETTEQRWARRDVALQRRIADIPSRFENDALYEPRPVGQAVKNAEVDFFGTSFTVFEQQVRKAAKAVSFQWPDILTAEEAEQELWVKLMESHTSITKLRDSFDDKQRLNALIQMGHQIANKLLTTEMVASGNFRYSVNTVKDILKDAAEQERDPEAKKLTKSALLDMTRGMEALRDKNAGYAEAISTRYRDGVVPTAGTSATRLSRALTALTTCMNREHKRQHRHRDDGPGSRKAIRKSRALVLSALEWQGNYGDGRR
jgi:hypothetical protein